MMTRLAATIMMILLLRNGAHADPPLCGEQAIDMCAKQYEQIASLFVEYDVFAIHGGDQRRLVTVREWTARDLHYTDILHWYDNRLYPVNDSGANDQASNWFLWTPSRSIQCFVNRRRCHTWGRLPSAQRDPGFRFYSAIIGCLPPQLQARPWGGRSDVELDSGIPTEVLYFPGLARSGEWNCEQDRDGHYKYAKQSGVFQMTMLLSADGPRLLGREISKKGVSPLVIKFGKHRLLNGVWLPYCVSLGQKGVVDYVEMRVNNASLNDEDYASKVIALTLPPGSIVTSDREDFGDAFVSGGVDLLEDVVARSRDAGLHWRETKQGGLGGWQNLFGGKVGVWAWRIVLLGCGFAFGFFGQRLMRPSG